MTTQPYGEQEALDARAALRNVQAKARRVPHHELEDLQELDWLTRRRAKARRFIDNDGDYNRLRRRFLDELDQPDTLALKFSDEEGNERYATPYRSYKLDVDVELAEKVLRELDYDDARIDAILPRKHNAEALRRAASNDQELLKRFNEFAHEVPHISYVAFSDPVWGDDEEVDNVT